MPNDGTIIAYVKRRNRKRLAIEKIIKACDLPDQLKEAIIADIKDGRYDKCPILIN